MAATRDYVELVTVADNGYNAAARIEALLRKAGQPIRMRQITPDDELEAQLQGQAPDLMFCDPAGSADGDALIRRCALALPATPLLVVSAQLGIQEQTRAIRLRARDAVSVQNPEHLHFVVLRELSVSQNLRTLAAARAEISQLERRIDVLMNQPQDSIVYVQEGIILDADSAFAQALAVASPGALHGQPLLDWVSKTDQKLLKRALSRVARGRQPGADLAAHVIREDGQELDLHMQITPAVFEDEKCLELLIRFVDSGHQPAPPMAPSIAPEPPTADAAAAQAPRAGTPALAEVLARANLPMGIAFCSIDNSTKLEQELGYLRAHQLLCDIQQWLASQLPHASVYPDGDRNLIMLGLEDGQRLDERARLLVDALGHHLFESHGHTASVHLSLACAQLLKQEDAGSLLNHLKRQAAKLQAEGGNRYLVTGLQHDEGTSQDKRWKARLEHALEANHFALRQHLVASLEGDQDQRAVLEAELVDEVEPVRAGDFMPWLESCGLEPTYERWLLSQALAMLKAAAASEPASLFVHLGSNSLKRGDSLAGWLGPKLGGLGQAELVLCFSEETLLYNVAQARELLQALGSNSCVRLAVIGMDGSAGSLKLLKHLPLSFALLSETATKALLSGKGANESLTSCISWMHAHKGKLVAATTQEAHNMATLWQVGINYLLTGEVHAAKAA